MSKDIFSRNVKYFRKEVLRITQEKLGEDVGVAQHTISEYETKKDNNPSLDVIMALADEFGISEGQLLTCDYEAGGNTPFEVRSPNGTKEDFSYFENHTIYMYYMAVDVQGDIREAVITFDEKFDEDRKYLHGILSAGHEYDCKMVIEGNTTNATVYINGIGKKYERRINIAFFYPASKRENKYPGGWGVIVRLDDNNTLKGQRVIFSSEKLDYIKNKNEILKHLTNNNKNHDVYVDRYNEGKFREKIRDLRL